MADEMLHGSDLVGQLFGEGEGFAPQTGNALPQGIVETFNAMGFPGFLRDGIDPHPGHASLTTMAAVGRPHGGGGFAQQ